MAKPPAKPQTSITNPGTPFRRLAPVKVPTLQLLDDDPVYVKITGPIKDTDKNELDEKGNPTTKTIRLIPVVDLQTGELSEIVAGTALVQNLRDYKGGNFAYVGLCFEIIKHKRAEGKKWKAYSIFEIEAPASEEKPA